MDGFSNGYQMIDSIVSVSEMTDYKKKRKEEQQYKSTAKRKQKSVSLFEEQLNRGMAVYTTGYGPNATKTEFLYQQKRYL